MITITFREQYDKLVKAYLAGEVNPWRSCACFVGNLLNKADTWAYLIERGEEGGAMEELLKLRKRELDYFRENYLKLQDRGEALSCIRVHGRDMYSPKEIVELEALFMRTYGLHTQYEKEINEEKLFEAFEVTLLKLREIHESKGEVIEDYIFKKREPVKELEAVLN